MLAFGRTLIYVVEIEIEIAKPCMLAAMTAAPLRGFLVYCLYSLSQ